MGVMSILKYAVPTFQCEIVKNGCISTYNESEDKVITLKKQKRQQKYLIKGVPFLSPFQAAVTVGHCFLCDVQS